MLYIIGIFVSVFLALILFTKKGTSGADLILGIWMLFIGFHLFAWYSYIFRIPYYMTLVGLNIPLPFLHGPFLYIYTRALCQPSRLRKSDWIPHFLLPALILVPVLPFTFSSGSEKLAIIEANSKGYRLFSGVLFLVMGLSAVFYVYLTNRLLSAHRKRILQQFSNRQKVNLNWLQMLFYGMAVMWILILFVRDDRWIFSAAAVFVIYMGYFGIKQVGIFTNTADALRETNESIVLPNDLQTGLTEGTGPEKKKYAKSGLDPEASLNLHRKLQLLMENEKPYIQPELTLAEIAAKLQAHPNHVSQVINEMEGKNFYDYINTLRVEAFQRAVLLPENQRFTLFSLALECGFNSKSAFNRFFKKTMGMSPSDYLKGIKVVNK
jgi:AraC-like DNA-binding protein